MEALNNVGINWSMYVSCIWITFIFAYNLIAVEVINYKYKARVAEFKFSLIITKAVVIPLILIFIDFVIF